jgi:hypothetical protein
MHRSPGVVYSYSLNSPDGDAKADNEEYVRQYPVQIIWLTLPMPQD